nr:uncharacterized protein LOC123752374 [Procambarus clarkii]
MSFVKEQIAERHRRVERIKFSIQTSLSTHFPITFSKNLSFSSMLQLDLVALLYFVIAINYLSKQASQLPYSFCYTIAVNSQELISWNRSELKEFKGCLSGDGLAALPPSLEQLSLALVDDDQARNLLPRLHAAVTSRLPRLWLLEVRVAARVTPAALVPLPRPQQVTPAAPGTRGVWLELSDVSDAGVSRACHVASLLQPPGGYGTISYPGATMTAAGCEDMIRDLRHHRVKVEQFVVPRAIPLSDHQLDHLITLARTMRGSYFWR